MASSKEYVDFILKQCAGLYARVTAQYEVRSLALWISATTKRYPTCLTYAQRKVDRRFAGQFCEC